MSNTMYGKGSKVESTGKLQGAQAHKSGDGSGPTGSSRSYPKGKGGAMKSDFNPQKVAATDYAVGGVGG